MRYKIGFPLSVRISLIALLLMVFATSAFAQGTLSGRVFELHTRIPVGGAKVENLNTHAITTTDTGGRFTIPASRRDLIAYSALAYKKDSVLVTNLNYKEVFLESISKQLKDVDINANNADVNAGGGFGVYVPPSPLGGQTLLYTTNSAGETTGGLTLRIPGGKDKASEARRKEIQLAADDKTQIEIKKRFSAGNLKNFVPLTGLELDNFIILYTPPLSVYRSREFNFTLYINNSYKEFRDLPIEQRQSKTLSKLKADTPPEN